MKRYYVTYNRVEEYILKHADKFENIAEFKKEVELTVLQLKAFPLDNMYQIRFFTAVAKAL